MNDDGFLPTEPDPAAHPILDRAGIERRIPHRGSMCLLAGVDEWDEHHIRCHADSHRDPCNPLREPWGLPAASAIEYAAQAMALHGALLSGADDAPQKGYLASVRGVEMRVERLDTVPGPLRIHAERLAGDGSNVLYAFTVEGGDMCLVRGRAAVILDAGTGPGDREERPS